MEIDLEINKKILNCECDDENLSNKFNLKLHYIPANIDGNSAANVEEYFSQYVNKETSGILTNTFRGYPLQGCNFNLPENYNGVVFQEIQKPLDENASRKFKAIGSFEDFTYWNYDKVPSKNDAIQKALNMIDVAEAVIFLKILNFLIY